MTIRRSALAQARLRRHWPQVEHGLTALYGDRGAELAATLRDRVVAHVETRPDRLFARDLEREAEPDWFQQPDMVGYVAYTDLFADTLAGVEQHLDYLDELGITYLHLMPLLKSRAGESDGGYAVASYDEVDPRLGTIDDLRSLADNLHARGMNLVVDLVVNHTAAEHPWAEAARAGDPHYRDFYFFFPDREMPDRYERTLREIFPAFAPGSFTWLEDAQQWVWTTFNTFQWDLNWQNPNVFSAMVDVLLNLADIGIDALRLDAVPFMWKREGTDCENLPEVHTLLCTLRAVMAVAAPATIFKAEAIVPPELLTPYVGAGDPERHECEIAYHNQLMVLLWSSIATNEAQLMANSLKRITPIPSHATWVTYARCHDDIGWAITDENAATVGWNGFHHRNFLNEFFSGAYPDSFAHGEVFQFNPATGDGRISGTAASLCGIEKALAAHDEVALDRACRRLELMYATVYSYGGIPLLYMGDELGLVNDYAYLDDPDKAADNRWVHRPRMNWDIAKRTLVDGTVERRLFGVFASLAHDRAGIGAIHGSARSEIIDGVDREILAFRRRHAARGAFVMAGNFGTDSRFISHDVLGSHNAEVVRWSGAVDTESGFELAPLGYVWLLA